MEDLKNLVLLKSSKEELIQKFLEHKKAEGKTPKTIVAYQWELNKFFDWYSDSIYNINIEAIDEFLIYLSQKELDNENRKQVGLQARRRTRSVLKTFMYFLIKKKIIPFNADTNPELIMKLEKPNPRILPNITELQFLKMEKLLKDNPDGLTLRNMALLAVMFYTGMRPDEIIRMETGWINKSTLEVIVYDGKGGKDRTTIINNFTIKIIERYVKDREGIIFLNKDGQPFSNIQPINYLIQKLKKLDPNIQSEITPYSFRRGFACYSYLKSGKDIMAVKKWLGHRDIKTTQRYLENVEFENIYRQKSEINKIRDEID